MLQLHDRLLLCATELVQKATGSEPAVVFGANLTHIYILTYSTELTDCAVCGS